MAYTYVANSPLVSQITFKTNNTTRMTTTKQYDLLNRLQSISSAPSATGVSPVSFTYSYNPANQRTGRTEADAAYWVYQYDSLGQVTSGKKYFSDGTPVPGQQFEYGFDDIGNRTSTKAGGDSLGTGLRSATYAANTLNQYTSREVPNAFDVLGASHATNTVTVNGSAVDYRRGEYFQELVSVVNSATSVWQTVSVTNSGGGSSTGNVFVAKTPEPFTYDLDGNLTQDGRWTYTWDAENRLTQAESLSSNPTAAKRKVVWEYDAKGRRIRQTTSDKSSGSYVVTEDLKLLCDGWACVAELNYADNALKRSYVWGTDLSGSMTEAGGVGGLLMINSVANGVHFYAMDGNGNVTALVKATDGTASANYEYDPFGQTVRATGPMAIENRFGFSTKRIDRTTDFVLYEYRIYDSSTGRWLSKDPKGESPDGGLYVFVRNQPMIAFDRLGLNWVFDIGIYPRRFNVPLYPGELGRTWGKLLELKYATSPCGCGERMNDFRLRARVSEFFSESEAQAGADGSIAHEDAHARAYKKQWEQIANGAQVIYMKCVSHKCFAAWQNWWDAVKAHADAVANLEHDEVDFNDPGYDPTKKPTATQVAADASAVTAARGVLETAQAVKAKACGF